MADIITKYRTAENAYTFFHHAQDQCEFFEESRKRSAYDGTDWNKFNDRVLEETGNMKRHWNNLRELSRELVKEQNLNQLEDEFERNWIVRMVKYTEVNK